MGSDPASATGPIERLLVERLSAALTPSFLNVMNESALHRGHAGDDGSGESHFRVEVESAAFTGLSRVERQRRVNHAVADLLAEHVHAFAIRAWAPGEAK